MATSLSHETSNSHQLLDTVPSSEKGALSSGGSSARTSKSDAVSHGAQNASASYNNRASSLVKNRGGESSPRGRNSSYIQQQQQSSLIQNAGLSYPFLYPNSYHLAGFPSAAATPTYSAASAGASTASSSSAQGAGAGNNRRGGKKKAPAPQAQNPEFRLFFSLRRRDSTVHTNKGPSHVYKPKNPPSIQDWFKRLSVEERVGSLSTVCPHLTETFVNMYQRADQSGQSSFAKIGPHNQSEHKYFTSPSPYHHPQYGYPGFGHFFPQQQDTSSMSGSSLSIFEDMFYHRSSSEAEFISIRNSERPKIEAEQEILKHVRLTDYFSYMDTLTVSEELVKDPDYFFKLMSFATSNQAFFRCCNFELKAASGQAGAPGVTAIEQPPWFKPKSFHTFAIWIIVALEENLWAHFNYHNNANLGSGTKVNDLASMFRERTDVGVQDVDLGQLAQFWHDMAEKQRRLLTDQFRAVMAKEWEQESGHDMQAGGLKSKVVQNKNVNYSLQIKDRSMGTSLQQNRQDFELYTLIEQSMRVGSEQSLMTALMYTSFDRASQRQVNMNRKFLEMIKKKYKDDLMENLLLEECSKGPQGLQTKAFKKKKKKAAAPTVVNDVQECDADVTVDSTSIAETPTIVKKQNAKKKKAKVIITSNSAEQVVQQEQVSGETKTKQRVQKKKQGAVNSSTPGTHDSSTLEQKEGKPFEDILRSDPHSCDDQIPVSSNKQEALIESDNKNSSVDTKSSNNQMANDGFLSASAHSNSKSQAPKKTAHTLGKQSVQLAKEGSLNYISSINSEKTSASLSKNSSTTQAPSLMTLQQSKSQDLQKPGVISRPSNNSIKQKQYNQSHYIKQQKPISLVESKNMQILQNPPEQQYKVRDKTQINIPENNDESIQEETASPEGSESIQEYLLQLTYQMISDVCLRVESESPKRVDKVNADITEQETLKPLIMKSLGPTDQVKSSNVYQRKDQQYDKFYQENGDMRKKSFNTNGQNNLIQNFNHKEEPNTYNFRKSSGDANQGANSHRQLTSESTSGGIADYQGVRRLSNNDSAKSNSSLTATRKGFGIHLKTSSQEDQRAQRKDSNIGSQHNQKDSAWAKGTAKQPEPGTTNKKKPPQAPRSRKQTFDGEQDTAVKKSSNVKSSQVVQPQQQKQPPQGEEPSSVDESAVILKKKRNKKKSKLTDTDIMNNFMKSMHSHAEDSAPKLPANQKKKEPVKAGLKAKKDEMPPEVALTEGQLPVIEEVKKHVGKQQHKHHNKKDQEGANNAQMPHHVGPIAKTNQHRRYTEDEHILAHPLHNNMQGHVDCAQSQESNQSHQNKKGPHNGPSSKQSNNSKNKQNKPRPPITKPTEASQSVDIVKPLVEIVISNIIDEGIHDHLNHPLRPQVEQQFVPSNEFTTLQIPLHIEAAKINSIYGDMPSDTNEIVALPIAHTVTDTSLDNKAPVKYQSYQNTPSKMTSNSKAFTKSTPAQIPQSNEQSQDSKEGSGKHQNFRTPPQTSKKQGGQVNYFNNNTVGAFAKIGDPPIPQQNSNQSFKKLNYNNSQQQQTHRQDFMQFSNPTFDPNLLPSPFGYMNQSAPPMGMQSTYGGIQHHMFQPSPLPNQPGSPFDFNAYQQQMPFYPTNMPLQASQSMMGYPTPMIPGPFVQTMSAQYEANKPNPKGAPQQKYRHVLPQVAKPDNIPPQKNTPTYNLEEQMNNSSQNSVFIQPMNISQSMQEQQYLQSFTQDNNMYYQDPMENSSFVDFNAFAPKLSSEQVFPYVEKMPLQNIAQPIPTFSPQPFQMGHHFQQPPPVEVQPNPFGYQRANGPQYFDQSQDLIFQIFNSIKSNNSLSPIPQILSPSPHLDFQMSQVSENGFQQQKMDTIHQQETGFYGSLDEDISNFVTQVQENLNIMKPERDFVLNKLQQIAQKAFADESPKLELFGSLITGLALESSDMDLAVTGLRIDDRYVMIEDLNKLAYALKDWQCLSSFKSIETASIPVIKMKVDLEKLRQIEMTEREEGDFARRPIPENQRYLNLDITFDDSPINGVQLSSQSMMMGSATDLIDSSLHTKTHLGLQSCALVQYYIANYRNLKQVAILLKKFLAIHNFNSPYYGGLSSYSAVILIVAYMNYYGLKNGPGNTPDDMSPSRLLMGFLDFYGNFFNPGSMGISVYDDGSFFQMSMHQDSNIVILDPLNLQNNTTKNSYLTKEILQKLQCTFNNLKNLMYKLPSLQQPALSSQAELSRSSSQEQKLVAFEKASPLGQTTSNPSNAIMSPKTDEVVSDFAHERKLLEEREANIVNEKCGEEGKIEVDKQLMPEEGASQKSPCQNASPSKLQINQEPSDVNLLSPSDLRPSSPTSAFTCLLETFFAKDALPIADLSGSASQRSQDHSQSVKGPSMIEEALAQQE